MNEPDGTTPRSITVRRAWLLVGFMWVAYFFNYTDRQVVFSIFPILKSELKFTDTELGLTGSIFLWVYALCSPIAGKSVIASLSGFWLSLAWYCGAGLPS